MRSDKALKNVMAAVILQMCNALSGIIVSKLLIEVIGSEVNGLVSSINQFVLYMGLVEVGIGNATIVALYGPLASNNSKRINSILSATKKYYNKVTAIYVGLVVLLMFIYPIISEGQFEGNFVQIMILIIASGSFIDFAFLGKYRALLTADQKAYILSGTQSISILINILGTVLILKFSSNIILIKSLTVIIFIIRAVIVFFYVRHTYKTLNFKEEPEYKALGQRWSVLIHQIASLVVYNTDIAVLTICLKNFAEISVYTVYNMIAQLARNMLSAISDGIIASFGEVIAKDEKNVLEETYSFFEYIYFIILFIIYTCVSVLIISFMQVYTKNMSDANYVRPFIAMLFVIGGIICNVRTPAITIISAAGYYKETKVQAILEASINIIISLLLVKPYGMAGVLVGTICSHIYRSIDAIHFTSKTFIKSLEKKTYIRILRNMLTFIILDILLKKFMIWKVNSFIIWILNAIVISLVVSIVIIIVNAIAEPVEIKKIINKYFKKST